jgi:hypothetical protein
MLNLTLLSSPNHGMSSSPKISPSPSSDLWIEDNGFGRSRNGQRRLGRMFAPSKGAWQVAGAVFAASTIPQDPLHSGVRALTFISQGGGVTFLTRPSLEQPSGRP